MRMKGSIVSKAANLKYMYYINKNINTYVVCVLSQAETMRRFVTISTGTMSTFESGLQRSTLRTPRPAAIRIPLMWYKVSVHPLIGSCHAPTTMNFV